MSAAVLIIEDDRPYQDLLGYLLTSTGYHVSVASGGKQGIQMALSQKPDIILCDILMDGCDGYEVARSLRGRDFRAELVAVTVLDSDKDCRNMRDAGFSDYMIKPVDPTKFLVDIAAIAARVAA